MVRLAFWAILIAASCSATDTITATVAPTTDTFHGFPGKKQMDFDIAFENMPKSNKTEVIESIPHYQAENDKIPSIAKSFMVICDLLLIVENEMGDQVTNPSNGSETIEGLTQNVLDGTLMILEKADLEWREIRRNVMKFPHGIENMQHLLQEGTLDEIKFEVPRLLSAFEDIAQDNADRAEAIATGILNAQRVKAKLTEVLQLVRSREESELSDLKATVSAYGQLVNLHQAIIQKLQAELGEAMKGTNETLPEADRNNQTSNGSMSNHELLFMIDFLNQSSALTRNDVEGLVEIFDDCVSMNKTTCKLDLVKLVPIVTKLAVLRETIAEFGWPDQQDNVNGIVDQWSNLSVSLDDIVKRLKPFKGSLEEQELDDTPLTALAALRDALAQIDSIQCNAAEEMAKLQESISQSKGGVNQDSVTSWVSRGQKILAILNQHYEMIRSIKESNESQLMESESMVKTVRKANVLADGKLTEEFSNMLTYVDFLAGIAKTSGESITYQIEELTSVRDVILMLMEESEGDEDESPKEKKERQKSLKVELKQMRENSAEINKAAYKLYLSIRPYIETSDKYIAHLLGYVSDFVSMGNNNQRAQFLKQVKTELEKVMNA